MCNGIWMMWKYEQSKGWMAPFLKKRLTWNKIPNIVIKSRNHHSLIKRLVIWRKKSLCGNILSVRAYLFLMELTVMCDVSEFALSFVSWLRKSATNQLFAFQWRRREKKLNKILINVKTGRYISTFCCRWCITLSVRTDFFHTLTFLWQGHEKKIMQIFNTFRYSLYVCFFFHFELIPYLFT